MKHTLLFTTIASIFALGTAQASSVVTSKAYVDAMDDTKVDIAQGTGDNNANVGKTLVVNSSGNLELGTPSATNYVEDSITDGVTDKAPSENAVNDALAGKQDEIQGYNSSTEVQSVLTDTTNDGSVGKRAILDMQTYSDNLASDMLVDDQYKDMIPDVGLIGVVLDEVNSGIDGIWDAMPQAMVWNNILDPTAVKRYSTTFNDGLNWPSSQENQFVTGSSLAQGLALKQNRQIGAPAGNSNSTDAGKVLVVGNDGNIAMGSAPDSAPTNSSTNLVTSGGVYTAVNAKQAKKVCAGWPDNIAVADRTDANCWLWNMPD